ncbi:TPA: SET domain-containing protein [Candidatus Woesearchaeota archaeon]|nr:SET domain-containing protein [Candidatus Woesearchaeota archaeon]
MAKVIKGRSKTEGFGLFATKDIKKGETAFLFTGRLVHTAHPQMTHRSLQISTWEYIDPTRKHLGWYLNHSCRPNCYVVGKNKITAFRHIKKGEEITIDYSFNTTYEGWDMRCLCKQKNCRKKLVSFQRLPKKVKMKGLKYASQHIKNFFE